MSSSGAVRGADAVLYPGSQSARQQLADAAYRSRLENVAAERVERRGFLRAEHRLHQSLEFVAQRIPALHAIGRRARGLGRRVPGRFTSETTS